MPVKSKTPKKTKKTTKPKIGRPSKYTPVLQKKAEDYFKQCLDGNAFITVERLALQLNINDDTVVEWSKLKYDDDHDDKRLAGKPVYPDFSAIYKKVKTLQKLQLKEQAFGGKGNVAMGIFLLKADHGLIETERREHTGPGGGPIEETITSVTYMPKPLADDYFKRKTQSTDTKLEA